MENELLGFHVSDTPQKPVNKNHNGILCKLVHPGMLRLAISGKKHTFTSSLLKVAEGLPCHGSQRYSDVLELLRSHHEPFPCSRKSGKCGIYRNSTKCCDACSFYILNVHRPVIPVKVRIHSGLRVCLVTSVCAIHTLRFGLFSPR